MNPPRRRSPGDPNPPQANPQPGPVQPGPARPRPDQPGPARPRPAQPGPAQPGPARPAVTGNPYSNQQAVQPGRELVEARVVTNNDQLEDLIESPPDLNVAVFAETGFRDLGPEVKDVIDEADLVVALGHVDLSLLARQIPTGKPALCVYGPQDRAVQPPPPFRWLHGNGVTFREWRIAGFSGAPRTNPTPGFYISEAEAHTILSRMPACDLLLSYAPPGGLVEHTPETLPFEALGDYVVRQMPLYHLFARRDKVSAEDLDQTLVVGLNDWMMIPPLNFV